MVTSCPRDRSLGYSPSLVTHLACCLWVERGGPSSGHPLVLLPTGHPGSAAMDNWSYRGLRQRSMSSLTAPSLGALGDEKQVGVRGRSRPSNYVFEILYQKLTRQPVDEPTQLLLGDVGPAEVKGDRLSPDDTAQHQGCDGLAAVQVDAGPQPLITAPGQTGNVIRAASPGEALLGSANSSCLASSRRKFL